jgi:hypothetical protein
MMKMTVNDTIWTVQSEKPTEFPSVRPWPMWVRARYDASSHSSDFSVVCGWLDRVHQKINLDALTINVTHQFHEPHLDAARIQRPEHVQDADGLTRVHANW